MNDRDLQLHHDCHAASMDMQTVIGKGTESYIIQQDCLAVEYLVAQAFADFHKLSQIASNAAEDAVQKVSDCLGAIEGQFEAFSLTEIMAASLSTWKARSKSLSSDEVPSIRLGNALLVINNIIATVWIFTQTGG